MLGGVVNLQPLDEGAGHGGLERLIQGGGFVRVQMVHNQDHVLGVGYVVYTTPDAVRTAEIAFTVEEDYQDQGLASHLLRHLTRIARENGVKRFTAEVLAGNPSMLAVFSHCGLPMETKRLADVVQVILRLDE